MNARFVVTADGKVTVTGAVPVRRTAPVAGPLAFAVGDWVARKSAVSASTLPGKVVEVRQYPTLCEDPAAEGGAVMPEYREWLVTRESALRRVREARARYEADRERRGLPDPPAPAEKPA